MNTPADLLKQQEIKTDNSGLMLALGFFDCLHYGHRQLMKNLKALASRYSLTPAVFTFDDDFYASLGCADLKYVYTLDERLSILKSELGISDVLIASPSAEFIKKSGKEFIKYLEAHNVKGVIAGEDFRFGIDAEYGLDELKEWAVSTHRVLVRQALIGAGGKKISTKDVRYILSFGEMELAKSLLCRKYFIDGVVTHGRGVGKSFGLPTANIYVSDKKALPLEGVYSTRIIVDGKKYKGVTNVGSCPTFGDVPKSIETYILDFDEDIYDKKIRVEFVDRLRGTCKFEDKTALKKQIDKDIERVVAEND